MAFAPYYDVSFANITVPEGADPLDGTVRVRLRNEDTDADWSDNEATPRIFLVKEDTTWLLSIMDEADGMTLIATYSRTHVANDELRGKLVLTFGSAPEGGTGWPTTITIYAFEGNVRKKLIQTAPFLFTNGNLASTAAMQLILSADPLLALPEGFTDSLGAQFPTRFPALEAAEDEAGYAATMLSAAFPILIIQAANLVPFATSAVALTLSDTEYLNWILNVSDIANRISAQIALNFQVPPTYIRYANGRSFGDFYSLSVGAAKLSSAPPQPSPVYQMAISQGLRVGAFAPSLSSSPQAVTQTLRTNLPSLWTPTDVPVGPPDVAALTMTRTILPPPQAGFRHRVLNIWFGSSGVQVLDGVVFDVSVTHSPTDVVVARLERDSISIADGITTLEPITTINTANVFPEGHSLQGTLTWSGDLSETIPHIAFYPFFIVTYQIEPVA